MGLDIRLGIGENKQVEGRHSRFFYRIEKLEN